MNSRVCWSVEFIRFPALNKQGKYRAKKNDELFLCYDSLRNAHKNECQPTFCIRNFCIYAWVQLLDVTVAIRGADIKITSNPVTL